MRWVKPDGPRIYTDRLIGAGPEPILVGSPAWYAWLTTATSFVWRIGDDTYYRARRETRRGQAYWYVACRVGGKVRRFYLGVPADLSLDRLVAVATEIATARQGQ